MRFFFCVTEVTKANVTMELPPLTPIVQTTKAPPLQDKLPLDRKLSIQIGQGKILKSNCIIKHAKVPVPTNE